MHDHFEQLYGLSKHLYESIFLMHRPSADAHGYYFVMHEWVGGLHGQADLSAPVSFTALPGIFIAAHELTVPAGSF